MLWALFTGPLMFAQPLQAFVSADTGQIIIGTPLQLTFQVRLPSEAKVSPPDTTGLGLAGIEALSAPQAVAEQVAGANVFSFRIPLTAWDSGWYLVPPMVAKVQFPDGHSETAQSPGLRFRADYPGSALQDTVQLAPNRANEKAFPRTIGEQWARYRALALAILASALLVGLALWLRRRKQLRLRARPRLSVVRAEHLPHEIALEKLEALRAAMLWTKDEVPEHYVALSHLLREYLENRFSVPALESTTEALGAILLGAGINPSRIEHLLHFAQAADLVKFAKSMPDAEACLSALDQVQQLIEGIEADASPSDA